MQAFVSLDIFCRLYQDVWVQLWSKLLKSLSLVSTQNFTFLSEIEDGLIILAKQWLFSISLVAFKTALEQH